MLTGPTFFPDGLASPATGINPACSTFRACKYCLHSAVISHRTVYDYSIMLRRAASVALRLSAQNQSVTGAWSLSSSLSHGCDSQCSASASSYERSSSCQAGAAHGFASVSGRGTQQQQQEDMEDMEVDAVVVGAGEDHDCWSLSSIRYVLARILCNGGMAGVQFSRNPAPAQSLKVTEGHVCFQSVQAQEGLC